ncbi:hypothetical protein [Streptomyces sp. NPDC052015]|uniref:hypothetical protein n=1 Tax=Streptomyces sp. NPDC052015 TaxID=3154755 RepID=UPI00341C2DA8
MGKVRRRKWGTALAGVAIALMMTNGRNPYGYYSGTGVHDATVAEVAGAWEYVKGTRAPLRRDGTAVVQRLDGQDFDFDDG